MGPNRGRRNSLAARPSGYPCEAASGIDPATIPTRQSSFIIHQSSFTNSPTGYFPYFFVARSMARKFSKGTYSVTELEEPQQ